MEFVAYKGNHPAKGANLEFVGQNNKRKIGGRPKGEPSAANN